MIDIAAHQAALEPTRAGLDAAGFGMSLAEREGRLQLVVIATAAACEDCLVPKTMFKRMALDEIAEAGLKPVDLDIVYPIDRRPKQG